MELKKYVGKVVKIELSNGQYFRGTVESSDEDSIFLIDINGSAVDISSKNILFIKEARE